MQNFIMRPHRLLATTAGIFLIAILLAGCSAARLGYSNGETISYWWLNNYIGFEPNQKPWLKKHIADLFAWHRKTQLQGYMQVLTRTQLRIPGNVTEAELLADYDNIKKHLLVLTDRALPDMADLALSLQPHQIANIEEKFSSNNDDYRKDYLRGNIEQRQRFRYKKALKQAEHWFGNFSTEQERQIRAASDARPLNNELVLADRLRRQAALIALLNKIHAEKPGREATMAMLKEHVVAMVNHFANPEHKAFFDASTNGSIHLIAVILNNATQVQKEHFGKTLQDWIDDFNELSV